MCGKASKERLLRLQVATWVCREETKGMYAEEVMCCLMVKLTRDPKEGKKLLSTE